MEEKGLCSMKGVDGSGGWLLENNEPRHGSKDEFDKNALHTDTKSAILEFCSGGRLFFFPQNPSSYGGWGRFIA